MCRTTSCADRPRSSSPSSRASGRPRPPRRPSRTRAPGAGTTSGPAGTGSRPPSRRPARPRRSRGRRRQRSPPLGVVRQGKGVLAPTGDPGTAVVAAPGSVRVMSPPRGSRRAARDGGGGAGRRPLHRAVGVHALVADAAHHVGGQRARGGPDQRGQIDLADDVVGEFDDDGVLRAGAPNCGAASSPTGRTARRSGCRSSMTAAPSGSPARRRTWAHRPARGTGRAWSTCRTPRTPSCGGPRNCSSDAPTGWKGSAARMSPATWCDCRSSRSGRSPRTWRSPPECPTVMGTRTGRTTSTGGRRSRSRRAGPTPTPPGSAPWSVGTDAVRERTR